MTESELHDLLKNKYPKENENCEWKKFKTLKHAVLARVGEDLISYISGISNSGGGTLFIGIEDKTLEILNSAVKIRWNPKTIDNQDKDFEIFSIP